MPTTTHPPYCRAIKGRRYLRFLHLARLSKTHEDRSESNLDNTPLLEDLNSLSANLIPAIRPILPLIYRNVGLSGLRDQLQPKTQSFLKNLTLLLIATELRNQQWLLHHLELFQKASIPVILLKGAAFSQNLYPDNAPRLGADLDILVHENEFDISCHLLSKTMKPVLPKPKRVATYETLFERVFIPKDGNGPTVEIHRDLTNPYIFSIDNQELWRTSRRHPAYNSKLVRVLSPENSLLHLAVHAFRDLDFCTHNLLDAHEAWCKWQPDHEKLMKQATKWGARNVLSYLLTNCQDIMKTPIPNRLLDSLRSSFVFDGINREILQSSALHDAAAHSPRYRLLQMLSQITFPDHMHRGILFQISYACTRLHDWYIYLRSI